MMAKISCPIVLGILFFTLNACATSQLPEQINGIAVPQFPKTAVITCYNPEESKAEQLTIFGDPWNHQTQRTGKGSVLIEVETVKILIVAGYNTKSKNDIQGFVKTNDEWRSISNDDYKNQYGRFLEGRLERCLSVLRHLR